MKTNTILTFLTTAFLFAASVPCFSETKFLIDQGDGDSGKVVITSKVLTSAEAQELGMVFVVSKLSNDEVGITLELKKEGMLKHFSSFRLSVRDGGKPVFGGELNSNLSKPDCAFTHFTLHRSLLAKARLSIHADDERDPKTGPYDDVHARHYVLNLEEHVPADLLPKAGGLSPQTVPLGAPNAKLWPPSLDEKRLIGTWVRKNQPIQGVENNTLMIIREDHTWTQAEISGPLSEPVRIQNFANDSIWDVVNIGDKNTQTVFRYKFKDGGSNAWNITKVGADELDFWSWGPSVHLFEHYTRCDAQTAAKLNERLNQKKTEPTAK